MGEVLQLRHRVLQFLADAARVLREHLFFRRQGDLTRRALEQRDAGGALDAGDLLAEGALRQVAALRGAREMLRLHQGEERVEIPRREVDRAYG